MLEDTVTEGWEEDVEGCEEAEGWEEDVESWESWEETESWEDDADVVLFRIWSRGGVESWGRGWGVEGVREVRGAGCRGVGVVGVDKVRGAEVRAALAGWGVVGVDEVLSSLGVGVVSVGVVRGAGCRSWGVVGVEVRAALTRGVEGVREVRAALGVVGVEGCHGVVDVEEFLAALACGWGVVDVWPIEAKISAGTESLKGGGLLERVVDEGGMFRWLLGWEGVEDFLRDIFIFKEFCF